MSGQRYRRSRADNGGYTQHPDAPAASPETPAEVWREVPKGTRVTRETLREAVLADGYNPAHVDAYMDACARPDAGFVVIGRASGFRRYFERVQP